MGDELFALRIGPDKLHNGESAALRRLPPASQNRLHDDFLGRREFECVRGKVERQEERRDPFVEVVQTFEITDDSFIGA